MQIPWIRKIQLFRRENPSLQSCWVKAAYTFRIRVCFKGVLPKLFKEQCVVFVILKK
jgi:hypothetical protein